MIASWESVSYTERELEEQATALYTSDTSLSTVGFRDDMSGLVAEQVPDSDGSTPTHQELMDEANTDVPVTWSLSSEYAEDMEGRGTGTAPFYGGSRIKDPVGNGGYHICSTGLRVVLPNGNNAMLTANHCSNGNAGVSWKLFNDGSAIGQTTGWSSRAWDIQGIDGNPYSTGGVWVGGALQYTILNGVTEGSGRIHDNALLSVSGGFSGSQYVRVINPNATVRACDNNGNNCTTHHHFVKVRGVSGDAAFGQGDSGSPVVIHKANGRLQIAGIASAAVGAVIECDGMDLDNQRYCRQLGYISPWYRFKVATGVKLP